MAASIILSAVMAFIIWFFILAGGSASVGTWAWAAFLAFLFFRMQQTGKISRYRRAFFVAFAFLFAVSFITNLIAERGSMSQGENTILAAETPMCNIVIPLVAIPYALTKTLIFPARISGHYASVVGVLLLWFIATITIGRGWCSWVCFYGGFEDGASRLAKKARVDVAPRNRDVRAFHFAFLFFLVLATLGVLSAVYCEWFCPFKLVTEFSPVVDFRSLIEAATFISAFVGLVVVMPILTRKRFQCSSFCPFGAFQSLVDRASGYRVVIDTDKCVKCLKCVAACQLCAIDRETILEKRGKPELTCAKCGECIDACPTGAIRYEFRFAKKGCRAPAPRTAFGRFVQGILDPKALFVFSAFTLSVIVSSGFGPDGIDIIIKAIAGGIR